MQNIPLAYTLLFFAFNLSFFLTWSLQFFGRLNFLDMSFLSLENISTFQMLHHLTSRLNFHFLWPRNTSPSLPIFMEVYTSTTPELHTFFIKKNLHFASEPPIKFHALTYISQAILSCSSPPPARPPSHVSCARHWLATVNKQVQF